MEFMSKYKALLNEFNTRKLREEKILYEGKGITSFDKYQYSLGRLHLAKEFIKVLEEFEKNDRT